MANYMKNGPIARMIKLPQGHYRRVGNSDAPDFLKDVNLGEHIFEDLQACCENTCFVNEDEYAKLKPNSELFTDACGEKLQELTGADDAQLFYDAYSNKLAPSVNETGVQTSFEVEDRVEIAVATTQEHIEQQDSNRGEQLQQDEQQDQDIKNEQEQAKDAVQDRPSAMTDRLNQMGITMQLDPNNPDVFKNNGVPTLFYTKGRINPTLVIITIDYELQVIYMSRNSINRFFPIKLISRLVTSPDIIQEEFDKHIEADREIKLDNTILINAANFTDSVAIQFPDPILKDRFTSDLKQLKADIRNQHQ
uniref:Uncharacterized protein n=1 Tax=Babesia bovis TaxID=5865 RepID=S6B0J6_BABBO|nr:hypothetical protein [Babesia bovis]